MGISNQRLDGMYVWSIQGEEGLKNGAYIGFFDEPFDAVKYFNQVIEVGGQWKLYETTTVSGDVKLREVSFSQAS